MSKHRALVLFLDDNEDLRALSPVLLEGALGVECVCLRRVVEFEKREREVLRAKIAILDINLGPDVPDGIDAFNWLMDRGFQGKVLFLTGHARTNPRVELAVRKGAQVFEEPAAPHKLVAAVNRSLDKAA